MSKERLELIREMAIVMSIAEDVDDEGKVNTVMKDIFYNHFDWMYQQALLVLELERSNKQLKNNLSVVRGYYKNMVKINEDIVRENKRLREVIIKRLYEFDGNVLEHSALADMLCAQALEESE